MSIFLSDFTLGNKTISVRGDEYRYGLYFVRNGSVYPADERHGFSVSETESISGNEIVSRIEIRAKKETVIEKLFLRSGIDCYMDRYPQCKKEIEYIEKMLPEYLFDFSKYPKVDYSGVMF